MMIVGAEKKTKKPTTQVRIHSVSAPWAPKNIFVDESPWGFTQFL